MGYKNRSSNSRFGFIWCSGRIGSTRSIQKFNFWNYDIIEKRFQIGDVISVPGHTEGTVEHIGFRSTLIRKFDSTPITIPNYIFAEAPILNFTNRNYRRINWTIGLEYNSTLDQIKNLTEIISTYLKESDSFMVDDTYVIL